MKPPPINPQDLRFELFAEDDDFDVDVFVGRIKVAYAFGIRSGDRLRLADIRVQRADLHHRGVGAALLVYILGASRDAGIREVWGEVMQDALDGQPWLLDWYARHGFSVGPPDSECTVGGAFKIVFRS